MTDLLNPGNFDFFARYLLAGFIVIWVRSAFVMGERPRLGEMIVEAVVLSLVNQLAFTVLDWLWSLALPPMDVPKTSFLFEVLVLPALLGVAFGLSLSRGWNRALLRRLSMPVQNPIRRAYDFAFLQNRSEGFVIVTYADGTKVYGYFGEFSLAASGQDRGDLYLERIYDIGEDGQWYESSPPRGALLILDDLRSIEFLDPERGET